MSVIQRSLHPAACDQPKIDSPCRGNALCKENSLRKACGKTRKNIASADPEADLMTDHTTCSEKASHHHVKQGPAP